MDDPHSADELEGLRRFLDRLESKELTVRRGPLDVSQKQIAAGAMHRERLLMAANQVGKTLAGAAWWPNCSPNRNRRIAGQPWLRLGYDARQRVQEVRASDDADKLTIAHPPHLNFAHI